MLDLETRLFVFHDDNSVFSDFSNDAQDYSRDDFALVLDKDEDFLYLGFRKPINSVYVEMKTANTNVNTFDFEYFLDDGAAPAAFTDIPNFSDETKGFTRSGFLIWERNLTDEAKTTIDGQEAFWYRLRPSVTHSGGTEVQGINNVFSDDNDLITEVANIVSKFLAPGTTSHILSHVAARNRIIQDLRNAGHLKVNPNSGRFKDLNIFDILNVQQLREASKWRTLATIYDDVSDRPDDKEDQRSRKYNSRYKATMGNLQFLGIDVDDDGIRDINEELASATTLILRR